MTRPNFECSAIRYKQYKALAWSMLRHIPRRRIEVSSLPLSPSLPLLPGMLPPHGRPAPGEGARTPTKLGSCSNERSRLISAAVPAPVPRD